jgi:glycerol kinase
VSTWILAIDAGTTGVRCRAVFPDERPSVSSYREFTQHFPQPGWVEHDADEIWDAVVTTFRELLDRIAATSGIDRLPTAIGITNQRETVVAWDRRDGRTVGRAIVWQDRRTADFCRRLEDEGRLPLVRRTSGLVLDPYFSGSKMRWILDERLGGEAPAGLVLATVDSWLVWKLTGGRELVTDVSNASRTMLLDITSRTWSDEVAEMLGVPLRCLPEVRPSSGRFGVTDCDELPTGIPVSGIAGDQQAALFGQACFEPGATKNTYGTGSFVLMNVGTECPPPVDGLLTTIGWTIGEGTASRTTYAYEGAIFVTGAAIQWLRDGLGIISTAGEVGPLAAEVPDSGGVVVVPAFTGLGSPWWDPWARGTIVGITRGTSRAHIARAVVESMALQVRDAVEAMSGASGVAVSDLRVDGGASVMDLLLQIQADQLGIVVRRPVDQETTALGAALLAGLAEGVWTDLGAVAGRWRQDRAFEPSGDRTVAEALHRQWLRAVERSRSWAESADDAG